MSDRLDSPDEDATLDALARALPRVAPRPDLLDRILAATAEGAGAPAKTTRRLRRPRRGLLPILAAAALGAAAAAAITSSIESGPSLGAAAASAAVAGQLRSSLVSGRAELYRPESSGGELRLQLQDVPAPPPHAHYELWLLPRDSKQMTAVASFSPAGGRVALLVPLPAPDRYAALDISIQRDDGPASRSPLSLASGTFAAR